MKHTIIRILFAIFALSMASSTDSFAQAPATSAADYDKSQPFRARIYNKEFKVFMVINAYEQNIEVPGQEIFGEMAGYFRSDDDSRCWLITSCELSADGKSLALSITNDYGSEDLEATLSVNSDGVYTLKQLSGSQIKIARNKKWVKIPKSLQLTIK